MTTEERIADGNVGDKFIGDSRIISGTELDMYCTITGLRLEPFLKDSAAKEMGFKGRVVPGPFLFALVFGLLGERLIGLIHVKTEKLRVLAPLYPYDTVRVEVEVVNREEHPKKIGVFITWAWALKNQDDVVLIQGENT